MARDGSNDDDGVREGTIEFLYTGYIIHCQAIFNERGFFMIKLKIYIVVFVVSLIFVTAEISPFLSDYIIRSAKELIYILF